MWIIYVLPGHNDAGALVEIGDDHHDIQAGIGD